MADKKSDKKKSATNKAKSAQSKSGKKKGKSKTGKKPAPTDVMHVQIVLDRSGSMTPIAAATIDALNGFLTKQRVVPGNLRISLTDFDSEEPFRIITDAIPIAEMLDLTAADYIPRGATPLLDAIGMAIERCDKRVANDPDEDQLLVIITDGMENASTDFDEAKISKLLDKRQKAGWVVLFLGANQDSFATGGDLNMRHGNVRDFDATSAGIHEALDLVAEAVTAHRSMDRVSRFQNREQLLSEPSER